MANTKRGRGDTAIRLLRVIMYLETSGQGLSASEIWDKLQAEGIECDRRTVIRDLDVISNAHFPLIQEVDQDKNRPIYKFGHTTALGKNIHFEYHEILALYLARESLQALKGSPLIDHILSLTKKLEQVLGTSVTKELSTLSEYVAYRSSSTWHAGVSQEILDTVYDAAYEERFLEVEYKAGSGTSANEVTKRKLGPETIYFAHGGAYLIAKDFKDQKIKYFSLNRMVSATKLDELYENDHKFSVDEYVKESFGILSLGEAQDIELLIKEPIASFVAERRWHESQRINRLQGGISVKMRVKVNDELARWILSLGAAAEVVSPEPLRELVATTAQDISNLYKRIKSA